LSVALDSAVITGIGLFGSKAEGSAVSPVLVFTPATTVPIGGTITLTMPAGYFLGSAFFVSGHSSVDVLSGVAPPVSSTSTLIFITTSGATIGTTAVVITLSGLTLGSAQSAGMFLLATSAQAGIMQFAAPAILPTVPIFSLKPSAVVSNGLDLVVTVNGVFFWFIWFSLCLYHRIILSSQSIHSLFSQPEE